MYYFYPHDRLLAEREALLKKLPKYEDMKMLDAWNDTWSRIAEIDRLLETNP